MNLFVPYEDIEKSVRALDDKRLNKQILECYQILQVALGNSRGYENHPVVKHYIAYPNGCLFCAVLACRKYLYRFNKTHKYHDFFDYVFDNVELIAPYKNRHYSLNYIYVEYPATDPRCIRETDTERVTALFRDKLVRKWKRDIENRRPPRWTKRGAPEFWRNNRS